MEYILIEYKKGRHLPLYHFLGSFSDFESAREAKNKAQRDNPSLVFRIFLWVM